MNARLKAAATAASQVGLVLALLGCNPPPSPKTSRNKPKQRDTVETSAKDPNWQPSHKKAAVVRVGSGQSSGMLHNFCVNPKGDILACWGGTASARNRPTITEPTAIKVLSPEGNLVATWPLEFQPQAICVQPSGEVFVGGDGRLAKLDASGKILITGTSPAMAQPEMTDKEILALLKEWKRPASELDQYKKSLQGRRKNITAIGVTGQDVFIACPAPKGFAYSVYRMDAEFQHPKLVLEKLSGCCGQMDIAAREGKLWVAHNGRHRVECFDRDGHNLSSFGKHDRQAAEGFGGCCEPKNLRLATNGDVLAAESGPPVAIKRFTPEGKFLGVVAVPQFDSGCVRVTVDASPDGQRFYLLDTASDSIHTFAASK